MHKEGLIGGWFRAWSNCYRYEFQYDCVRKKVYIYFTLKNYDKIFKLSINEEDIYYDASNLMNIITSKYNYLLELELLKRG